MRLRIALPAWFALLGLGDLQGCRTAAPPEPTVVRVESIVVPVEVPDLPAGFRAELMEAPVFGGQVLVLEGGKPDGPVVVLVHGLGENGSRDFYPVLPALVAKYHIISFDLPGFGRSTHGTALYSPDRYVDFIRALVRQRVWEPFNLVGHSMGGAISLLYAARFPVDLQRLFLIDAAGFLHRKAYVNFAVSAGLDSVLGIFSGPGKELLDITLDAAAVAVGPLPATPEPDFLLTNDLLRATVLRTPTRIAALATMLENFAPAISSVQTPTWMLWGKNDGVASLRAARVLELRLPLARLQVLESSGHDPMSSEPASVSRFLLEGLAANPVLTTRPPQPALSSSAQPGRCEWQNGVRFHGDYTEIDIVGCDDVHLDGVRCRAIRVRDSVVSMQDTHVGSDGVALDVKNARLEITASDFVGDVALEASGSELDLAGVTLQGKSKSVHLGGASHLIFSISRVDSPVSHRYVHEMLELPSGAEL